MKAWRNRGILAAFAAALLFGAGTPIAKLLPVQTSPWLLASLLYLGSGIVLFALRIMRHASPAKLSKVEIR